MRKKNLLFVCLVILILAICCACGAPSAEDPADPGTVTNRTWKTDAYTLRSSDLTPSSCPRASPPRRERTER